MSGYEGPRTPHEEVVAYETNRNMQSAIGTVKAAAILGGVCALGYLGYQGLRHYRATKTVAPNSA